MSGLQKYTGILLDVGCGAAKQPNFVGLDKVRYPGVDIVHDLETFPYPLKDNSCLTIIAKQVVEYIRPQVIMQVFDELWRIMKPGGQLVIKTPYPGSSTFWSDPTICNGMNEHTFLYFDPAVPKAYDIYKPKPWRVANGFPCWQSNGYIEVIMSKRETSEITPG